MKVEWLILADFAQINGGKLYLMGGGWDVLTVNNPFPMQQLCGVAASFTVPWNETNQRHNVEIEVATQDGRALANIVGDLEIGRPAGIPAGQDQRAQLAGNLPIAIDQAGVYSIIARVEGQEEARIHFTVVEGPMLKLSKKAS